MYATTAALRGGRAQPSPNKETFIPFCLKFLVTTIVLALLGCGIVFLVISADAAKRCREEEETDDLQKIAEQQDTTRYEVELESDGSRAFYRRRQLIPPGFTLVASAPEGSDQLRRVIVEELNQWGVVVSIQNNAGERRRLAGNSIPRISGGSGYTPTSSGTDATENVVSNPCGMTDSMALTGGIMLAFGSMFLFLTIAVVTEGFRCCCPERCEVAMCTMYADDHYDATPTQRSETLPPMPQSESSRGDEEMRHTVKCLPPDEVQMTGYNDRVLELSERGSNA